MSWLFTVEPSPYTLFLFFAIPFCYFAARSRFAYRPDLLSKLVWPFGLIAIVLSTLVVIKVGFFAFDLNFEQRLLGILHLGPLLLLLMILSANRADPLAALKPTSVQYSPVPINQDIEKVSWEQLVLDKRLRKELSSVIKLLKDPKSAKQYGVDIPKGILLQGPPGTGKTTIAKAMANTAGLAFFSLRLDEIISKWVGDTEKNLSILFKAAQRHAPSVIFIDEVDSIAGARSSSSQAWEKNTLNHLLQLIDGIVKCENVFVIAATNRAEFVDSALKRPGRLDKIIEIPLPDLASRTQIFKINFAKLRLAQDVDFAELARLSENMSGAEIRAICNQAGLNAMQRESESAGKKRDFLISAEDITNALQEYSEQRTVQQRLEFGRPGNYRN